MVYATLVWSTREAEVALMFAGQLACEAANWILKRMIREERPRIISAHNKGYGMPSSHAQFVAFWAVALGLFLMVRHRPRGEQLRLRGETNAAGASAGGRRGNGTTSRGGGLGAVVADNISSYADPHRPAWSFVERAAASLLALALAALVAWSRVYLGYHTGRQVLVGWVAGAVCAAGWFGVTYVLREVGLLAWGLDLPLARWFRFRDLVVEEDLSQAGWEKWVERKRQARKDKTK